MAEKQGITREEMVRRIREAAANVPHLGKMDWHTIYLALSRERKRLASVLREAETLAESPESNKYVGQIRGEVEHINKIMTRLGQSGRRMLIHADMGRGSGVYVIDDDDNSATEQESAAE